MNRLFFVVLCGLLVFAPTAHGQRPDPQDARTQIAAANRQVQEAQAYLAAARTQAAQAAEAVTRASDSINEQLRQVAVQQAGIENIFPNEAAELARTTRAMVDSPSRRSQAQLDAARDALERAMTVAAQGAGLRQARARLVELRTALTAAQEAREQATELVDAHFQALMAMENNRSSVRNNLTERFNADAPAHALNVRVRDAGQLIHEVEWTDPEDPQLLELLRLAQFVEADLVQVLSQRDRRIEEHINETREAMTVANGALEDYTDWVGGSHPPGFWSWTERQLDSATELVGMGRSGGALVTSGTGTNLRILLGVSDSALTVGRDIRSGLPPLLSLCIELVNQLAVSGGRPARPWDPLRLPQHSVENGRAFEGLVEQTFLEGLNPGRVLASLTTMRDQIGPASLGDDFELALSARFDPYDLGLSLGHAIYLNGPPRLDIASQRLPTLNPDNWFFAQLQTGLAHRSVMKTMIEVAIESVPGGPRAPLRAEMVAARAAACTTCGRRAAQRTALRPWHAVVATELALDFAQAATVTIAERQIELARLSLWSEYIAADLDRQIMLATLQQEGRIRRFERRLLELVRETQNQIRDQIDRDNPIRSEGVRLEKALTNSFEVEIEFSEPVIVQTARIGGLTLTPLTIGAASIWRGWGARDQIGAGMGAAGHVTMEVVAHRASDPSDPVDGEPRTIARLNGVDGAVVGFETEPFRVALRLTAPLWEAAYGIVLDTSGSMDDGRLERAQSALIDMYDFGLLNDRTVATLTTFSGCTLSGTEFTNDTAILVQQTRNNSAGGSTPLAAAIESTARRLVLGADAERRYLIVLSDGDESCGGSVLRAMSYARGLLSDAERFE